MTQKQRAVGGCACGHLRYEITVSPMFVHACHCTWCQNESGSALVVNAQIETEYVELLSGTPHFVVIPSESGAGQALARCPACCSVVWSHYGPGPALAFLRVGTLDTPGFLQPRAHIFTRSMLPWMRLDPAIPAYPEFYDRQALWSPGALARRNAVLT